MIDRIVHWLGQSGLAAALLGKQAAVSLRQNWGIAALSLALAVSLWVYVTDQNDSERTARVPGSVPVECVNVPASKAVSPPCTDQTVIVRVRAPDSAIDELTSGDFTATADLTNVEGDTGTVRVAVDPLEPDVTVIDVSPAEITIRLEELTSRSVPIRTRLVGPPPRGFEVAGTTLEPEEAVVSGPASLVARVAAVEADLNLTGVNASFTQTLLLTARDDQGADLKNLTVDPESVQVAVEMRQLEFSATFIVEPVITGSPAQGYVATGLAIEPQFVTITGTADVFQTLDPTAGIQTEPISIDRATADVVRPATLRVPEGARVEFPTVTVRVFISQAATAAPAISGSP